MTLQRCASLIKQLEREINAGPPPFTKAKHTLRDVKLCLIQFPSSMGQISAKAVEERTTCRLALELACIMAIRDGGNTDMFEKQYDQLRQYYEHGGDLKPSERQYLIMGLNLMHLLVESRLSDFHSELELMSDVDRQNPCIVFPTQLEEYLMEGNYSKVLGARASGPMQDYSFFLDSIVNTVRHEVGSCCEASYSSLKVADAQKMLRFTTESELRDFANGKENWKLLGGEIKFNSQNKKKADKNDLPSLALVQQALLYATELERIV